MAPIHWMILGPLHSLRIATHTRPEGYATRRFGRHYVSTHSKTRPPKLRDAPIHSILCVVRGAVTANSVHSYYYSLYIQKNI